MIAYDLSKIFSRIFLLLLFSTLMVSNITAEEKVPSDIRYMLEDLYGPDKKLWPAPIYSKDLNQDGFTDWVAIKKNCTKGNKCPAEIFICKADASGKCPEYCYSEVKSLNNLQEELKTLKCESTC